MSGSNISFTSLGLVVLDEIRLPHWKPLTNVVGGSGTYTTLGARLFQPNTWSQCVGWMVHIGNDFPQSVRDHLEDWGTTLIIDEELDKPSTRGLLEYKDTTFGPKDFRYTTPVLAVEDGSLESTPLLTSKAFHYLQTPQDIKPRVSNFLAIRKESGLLERPLIIWEPAPPSCKPENLQACLEAASLVDVFSPNHLELAALFAESPSVAADKTKIEELALGFLNRGVGPEGKGTVIVRAGEHGCLVQTRTLPPTWVPPFYTSRSGSGQQPKVVDPTGAGNAFLGAYAVGYLGTGSVIDAACYGSVGASFALEQVGLPKKSNNGDEELWNGASVTKRLNEYMTRLKLAGLVENQDTTFRQSSWWSALKMLGDWLSGL